MRKLLLILLLSTPAWASYTCGFTGTSSGITTPDLSNLTITGAPCTVQTDSTVADGKIWITNGTGSIVMGIWKTDNTNRGPGTLVCQSSVVTNPTNNAFATFTFSGCPTLTAGSTYWLGTNNNNSALTLLYDAGQTGLASHGNWWSESHSFNSGTLTNLTSPSANNHNITMYLDLNATGSAYTNCGQTALSGNTSPDLSNLQLTGAPCTPASNSTVSFAYLWVTNAAVNGSGTVGTLAMAVYKSDGSGGAPGTLLCSSSATSPIMGVWNAFTLSGCGTLTASTVYWIAQNFDNSSESIDYYPSPGTWYFTSQTCCTFTNMTSPSSNTHSTTEYLAITGTPSGSSQIGVFAVGP